MNKMMNKLTAEHMQCGAIVYVRQSSMRQVANNLESQRLQYALAQKARELCFESVEVIDEDLGRSGSGSTLRPGFERLMSSVCAGGVGAVFSIEASRLARNGREWHNLIELCGLVGTLIIDSEGVYDPRSSNDRLLLGLKGTMSEFELTLFRQRSMEAIRQKAERGELRFCLPIGLCWTNEDRVELDPDRRVQRAIRLVFDKYVELGSVRQVLMWLADENLSLPRVKGNKNWGPQREVVWRRPQYMSVLAIIRNPLYAGAYVFGRSESRTRIREGSPIEVRPLTELLFEAWHLLSNAGGRLPGSLFGRCHAELVGVDQHRGAKLNPGAVVRPAQRVRRVQAVTWRHLVEVLVDHRGLEEHGVAILDDEHRHLAEGRNTEEPIRLGRKVDVLDLVRRAFLLEGDDAALHVGAEVEADELVDRHAGQDGDGFRERQRRRTSAVVGAAEHPQ